ncbi:MAG TPA: FmdB family zinc ribbon protein [Isosphaeraceae bacterium]|nr:FmdB family zinc ribbon protein [Isosphaeraceae bacterium]
MPTYDYICDGCGHEFEAFESIKADPQRICPECQAESLRRKLGPGAAILFKGSGFYQTDYRSDSYKKAARADKPSESSSSKSESSSSTKSDSGSSSSSSSSSSAAPAGSGAS